MTVLKTLKSQDSSRVRTTRCFLKLAFWFQRYHNKSFQRCLKKLFCQTVVKNDRKGQAVVSKLYPSVTQNSSTAARVSFSLLSKKYKSRKKKLKGNLKWLPEFTGLPDTKSLYSSIPLVL